MASLDTYRQKRDFTETTEPRGRKARRAGHSFVIQKHAATRLHYDLRLEMDGVLKSWAVTKGPSLDPSEKRLAVEVEDHPLDYGGFEGTIPKGHYGAGAVIIWDRGEWVPVGDPAKGLAKGHLEFELQGEKLHGRWNLVRMRAKPGDKRQNWLLIKVDDDAARATGDILTESPDSVLSGRSVKQVGKGDPPRKPAGKKAPLPAFVEPALATLRAAPPSGEGWLHEIKFDGYRLQARIDGADIKLLTRSGLDWTDKFGAGVVKALRALPVQTALLDAELVVETGAGRSDFSALQADLSAGRADRFVLYLFDLLYLDGQDLRQLPLTQRRAALEALVPSSPSGKPGLIRFSQDFRETGGLVLKHACRLSLEGIVSKQADAPYRSGRGKAWIKSKCSARQEFVVAGYVPSSTSDKAIGSLVLGVNGPDGLQPVGRVGTGFSVAVARDLFTRLSAMQVKRNPFARPLTPDEGRGAVMTRPELVAEVEFRAWTADGHLRHASFRGLRDDKPADQVLRETPAKQPAAARRKVALTHPDRIYWPAEGVTKEGLADYYAEIWPWIAPYVTGRPLALLRCPEGIDGPKFFQKHAWRGISKHVQLVKDPKDKTGQPLIAINDLDGLMALVQSAVLEIHPWGATLQDWERPDTLTMDLDPGEGVEWPAIIAAAREVQARLQDAGLAAFVKTSGGKGLHVVSPLKPKANWPAVKAFAKGLANAMAADAPESFVATITKSKRRGKILVDYLRNQRGMTAVAAYSTRARPGAAVSMPLSWDELDRVPASDHFTLMDAPTQLAALASDPWRDFRPSEKPLPTQT